MHAGPGPVEEWGPLTMKARAKPTAEEVPLEASAAEPPPVAGGGSRAFAEAALFGILEPVRFSAEPREALATSSLTLKAKPDKQAGAGATSEVEQTWCGHTFMKYSLESMQSIATSQELHHLLG